MPIALKREALARLFPNARPEIIAAVYASQHGPLARYEINKTARRLAYFLAQAAEESGGFRVFSENLNYTTAARLMAVWPSRFPTAASAQPFVRNPEGLANKVYGGRMGNTQPGDGWRFRGRCPIQITGRANYKAVGDFIGLDLVGHPDRALELGNMMTVQAGYWALNRLNRFADAADFRALTKAVNGGYTNMPERERWLARITAELANRSSVEEAASVPQSGPVTPVPPPPDVEPPQSAPAVQGGWITALLRWIASLFRRGA